MSRNHFVILLSLSCFLFFSCQSAPESHSLPPYPVEGEKISAEEAQSLEFRWKNPQASTRAKQAPLQEAEQGTKNPDQILRVYQFESREQQEGRTDFHFKLVEEATIYGNAFIYSELQTFLPSDQVYAWEVFTINANTGEKIPLQYLTHFSVGSPAFDAPDDELALQSFFANTQDGIECILQPNQCEDLTCWPVGQVNYNTHIATFDGFESDDNNFNFSTNSAGNSPNGGGNCFKVANGKIHVHGTFSVKVPYNKINSTYATPVEVFLFKGEEMLTGDDISWQFKLNGGLPETAVTLYSNDYLSYCDGPIGDQLIGRAQVEITTNYAYEVNQSYTLVFHIPTDQSHTHGSAVVNKQHKNLNLAPETNHSHDDLRLKGCQEDHLEHTLSYYDCMDRRDDHLAEHVVLIELTDHICPSNGEIIDQ